MSMGCTPKDDSEIVDQATNDTATSDQADTADDQEDTAAQGDSGVDDDTADSIDSGSDTGAEDSGDVDTGVSVDPFADSLISFEPGEGAGFGEENLPDVVLGSPEGGGKAGGVDVVSLGNEGVIILAFDDIQVIDGEGADLLVFENPFPNWLETGVVSVSDDLVTWHTFPCDSANAEEGYPGCAGVGFVYAASDNDIDATDPEQAGGDAFDLADLGVTSARYVRIQDSGENSYDGTGGGFDLDALAVVNGESILE